MIVKLVLDTIGEHPKTELIRAGLPVRFLDFAPCDKVHIALPDGRVTIVDAAAVGSGINGPEETLQALEELTGITRRVLTNAANDGRRLMARKSASTWLSTENAIEYAIAQGYIRAPKNS